MGKPFGQLSKEDIQMTNKHVKRYSTSIAIRILKVKITPTRMAIIKSQVMSVDKDVRKLEPSYTSSRNGIWATVRLAVP